MKRRIGQGLIISCALALALGLTLGCGGDKTSTNPAGNSAEDILPSSEILEGEAAPEGCNPIAEDWDCLFPYPSDFYRVKAPSLPSGFRVRISRAASPLNTQGARVDFHEEFPADGFSLLPQISLHIPGGFDLAGLAQGPEDGALSLKTEHRTLILDAEDGTPQPHFVESRVSGPTDFNLVLIRPLVALKENRRYIVLVHNATSPTGERIEPAKGFLALREGSPADSETLEPLREHYSKSIFPQIDLEGIDRKEVLIAWDFTTRTRANLMSDALTMRDAAMKSFEENAPTVEILSVDEAPSEWIAKRVRGTVSAPFFLDREGPGGRMNRDARGKPIADGSVKVPFTIQIPESVNESASPGTAPLLQFGHGFFQTQGEIEGDAVRRISAENGLVVMAADWWGLSEPDMVPMLEIIAKDPQEGLGFIDRLHQSFVNFMALTYAAKGPFLTEKALNIENTPCFDPEKIYYYGLSMGHIFGGTYVALSPHINRAALVSGGAGLSLITAFASPFEAFDLLLSNAMEGPAGSARFVAVALSAFDRVDALSYSGNMIHETFEGSPESRDILQQIGTGDPVVPNITSHVHARALGIPIMSPTNRDIFAIEQSPAPIQGSAAVEYDFIDPETGEVPDGVNVHEATRRLPASIQQLGSFFQPKGLILNTCDGACDPE